MALDQSWAMNEKIMVNSTRGIIGSKHQQYSMGVPPCPMRSKGIGENIDACAAPILPPRSDEYWALTSPVPDAVAP